MKVIKNFSLRKQNPDQRRDNLTPDESERIHAASSEKQS